MQVQSYLIFDGRCDEAIAFYRDAVGAEPGMLMRFKDNPEPPPAGSPQPPGDAVMHAEFRIGGTTVFASDGMHAGGKPAFEGFMLCLSLDDEAAARKAFEALAAGGSVTMPLARTFWSPCFGMLLDRFGVGWMVTVEQ